MGFGYQGAVATEGTGDFQDVPDDIYMAMVKDVSDPFVSVDPTTGNERTQVTIEWELMPRPDQIEAGCPEAGYTRKYWVTLTDNFLDKGFVDKKSKLYGVLEALGYDMTGELNFDSDEWQGKKAKVVIKHNKKNYPDITDLMKVAAPKAAPAPAQRRAPVGATGGGAATATRPRGAVAPVAQPADWGELEDDGGE